MGPRLKPLAEVYPERLPRQTKGGDTRAFSSASFKDDRDLKPQPRGFGQARHDVQILDAGAARALAQIVEPRDEARLAAVAIGNDEQVEPVAAAVRGAPHHPTLGGPFALPPPRPPGLI